MVYMAPIEATAAIWSTLLPIDFKVIWEASVLTSSKFRNCNSVLSLHTGELLQPSHRGITATINFYDLTWALDFFLQARDVMISSNVLLAPAEWILSFIFLGPKFILNHFS